jgi:hypothetical protein
MTAAGPLLAFVLDEDVPTALWRAVQGHNARSTYPIDAVQVGRHPALPKGTKDRLLLQWAEQADRLLVTCDLQTMPRHLADHLRDGRHSPGVLVIRPCPVGDVIEQLAEMVHASRPDEWLDIFRVFP